MVLGSFLAAMARTKQTIMKEFVLWANKLVSWEIAKQEIKANFLELKKSYEEPAFSLVLQS